MPDQPNKIDDKQQPTHSAAKVVIPFDIDLSAVEAKLADIERRMSAISSPKQAAAPVEPAKNDKAIQDQSIDRNPYSKIEKIEGDFAESKSSEKKSDTPNVKEEAESQMTSATMLKMVDLLRQINDSVSGSTRIAEKESSKGRSDSGHSVADMGTEKQLMMTTMMRMADLLRQINDMVTLIYNTQINNG